MSKIDTIVNKKDGSIRFECYCQNDNNRLCPECRDRIWLRLGQLINQETPPLISGMEGDS